MNDHRKNMGVPGMIAVANGRVRFLPASSRRVALLVSGISTGAVIIGEEEMLANASGFRITTTAGMVKLCCCDVGNWITRELWIRGDAAVGTVSYVEVLAPDEV